MVHPLLTCLMCHGANSVDRMLPPAAVGAAGVAGAAVGAAGVAGAAVVLVQVTDDHAGVMGGEEMCEEKECGTVVWSYNWYCQEHHHHHQQQQQKQKQLL
eukprot:jgi/Chrzof1/13606/Cz08g03290.t1